MNNFNLINNNLFKSLDGSNTLKTLIKVPITTKYGSQQIYSKTIEFDIPREYNGLEQMWIKCTLTTAGVANPQTFLGTRIFKEIRIRNKRGDCVLQHIYPEYTYARIDELIGTPVYKHLEDAIEPDQTFNNNTVTLYVPLFSWIANDNLETGSIEQLVVEAVVNDNKESMGLAADLTATSYELHCRFNDTFGASKLVPRTLVVTDAFREPDDLVVATGSTSCKTLFRCPEVVFVSHFTMVSDTQNLFQIDSLEIDSRGVNIVDLDRRTNYSLAEGINEVAVVQNGPLSYWWSKERSRLSSSGQIYFQESMYPVQCTLNFQPLDSSYKLKVIHEYKAKFIINDLGQISRLSTGFLETNALNNGNGNN